MNDKQQNKVYAISDYSDRTIGMKYVCEKIDRDQVRYDKPLIEIDKSKYIFYNEPAPDVREKILSSNQIYIVDKARFKGLVKIEFLNNSIKQNWILYQKTKNKYFLYDAICLYRYAETIPPLEIVSEAYELFSQIAEICISKEEAKEKQEQVLSLLNLKSRGKGKNTSGVKLLKGSIKLSAETLNALQQL